MIKCLLCLAIFASSAGVLAQNVTGEWNFQLFQFGDESARALLVLKADGEKVSGTLNELKLEGTVRGDSLILEATRPDGKPFGELRGEISGESITGHMKCSPREDTMCEWKATRIDTAPHKPHTYVFKPTQFVRLFSGSVKPVLHIRSGDTVITSTIDAGGVDANESPVPLAAIPRPDRFSSKVRFRGTHSQSELIGFI